MMEEGGELPLGVIQSDKAATTTTTKWEWKVSSALPPDELVSIKAFAAADNSITGYSPAIMVVEPSTEEEEEDTTSTSTTGAATTTKTSGLWKKWGKGKANNRRRR